MCAMKKGLRSICMRTLLGGFFVLFGCDRPVVYVSVLDPPSRMESLRVRVSLDGRVVSNEPHYFTKDLDRFSVRLSAGARGLLEVKVDAVGESGCDLARRSEPLRIERGGKLALGVKLVTLDVAECPELRVQHLAAERARIVSVPAGIDCGQQCTHTFAPGTKVRLTVERPAGAYHGWGGACQGQDMDVCDITVGSLNPKVLSSIGRGTCMSDGFCWQNPLPHGDSMSVASVGNELFAVGASGSVLRWDGALWQPMPSDATATFYAVGGLAQQADEPVVFAVGAEGLISRLRGGRWQTVRRGGPTLRAVWAAGSASAFAVGDAGTLLRWDGNEWRAMDSGTTLGLRAVGGLRDGNGAGTIVAAGERGILLRLDRATDAWRGESSATTATLHALVGASAEDRPGQVFVVGDRDGESAIILRWNGSHWVRQESRVTGSLFTVAGDSSSGFMAVGMDSNEAVATIRFDNSDTWQRVASHGQISRVIASNGRGLWVGVHEPSGSLLRWDGGNWTFMNTVTTQNLLGISGSDEKNVYAVGEQEMLFFNGQKWRREPLDTSSWIRGVWASTTGSVIAVGGPKPNPEGPINSSGYLVLHRNSEQLWQQETLTSDISFGLATVSSVFGLNDRFVFMGTSGDGVDDATPLAFWDGKQWLSSPWDGGSIKDDYYPWIEGVFIRTTTEAYAAGRSTWYGWLHGDGHILQWDGLIWKPVHRVPDVALNAVFGADADQIFVGGTKRSLLRKQGAGWTAVAIQGGPADLEIKGIHGQRSNLVAACSQGYVLHYDGTLWRALRAPGPAQPLNAVWSGASGKAYVVGASGRILTYKN